MASTGSGRGPIKVGSGYIDIFPKINQKQVKKAREDLQKQMGVAGQKAGRSFADGIVNQVAKVPERAKKAADKAQREIQKSARDSQKVLQLLEEEITKKYGKEAGKRFRQAVELEQEKQKLLNQTSAATRRALRETVREEEKAARDRARAWEAAERSYMKFLEDRRKAAERAAREEAAAHRRAHQQMREDLRRTLAEARSARLADLHHQMDAHRDQLASLRRQLLEYRRQMEDHTRAVGRSLTSLSTSWRKQGDAIERLGTNITETGRLITTNLLGPLGAVSAMLTTIGVKSADMRMLGQLGLSAAGVSKKASAREMRRVQEYAIATPFSIDVMHEYQMKLIRSIASADKSWYDKNTRAAAADRAAQKTTDIIMAVGDMMARAGNLNPEEFKRAMYAVDRIMDMDKAPTRNINQLVRATGIPASELAKMFGFESAGAFWKQVGTPVAKGGGISGQDMINNLLRSWDPNYFVMDPRTGKPRIDPRTGQPIVNRGPHSTAGGAKGYAEQMTAATISGRVSQIKERAQFELGSLFASEDPKTGEFQYTRLGEAIMGKRIPVHERRLNPQTGEYEMIQTGYDYRGGLLQQISELGADQKQNVITLLSTSLEALSTFVKQIQWFSDWLESHPQVREVFANLLKLAAVTMPFILAIGLATKTLGKITKLLSASLAPLSGLFKGLRGAVRTGRQVGAGVASARRGEGFRQGYRDRRTQLRGGDVRGPVARVRDRITGRDSGASRLRQDIRDTEDAIRDTEDGIRRLQRQIREVNAVSVRQLVDRFAGSGPESLEGAARNATSQVSQVSSEVRELNRQTLSTVRGEIDGAHDEARDLVQKLKDAVSEAKDLNGANLTGFKVTVDSAHGSVDDLKDKIDRTALSVSDLNKKKLDTVSGEFRSTTSTADSLHDKIQAIIKAVSSLNGEKLSALRQEFKGLTSEANEAYKKVGTTKSGLAGRITNLNNRSLEKVTQAVNDLKDALDDAADKAGHLDSNIRNVNANSSLGGGSSNKKNNGRATRKARGGVVTQDEARRYGTLPGYAPGVDSIPAVLSPGEAVLRPEVARALGRETIDAWNQAAIQGKIRHYAKGTAGAGLYDKLTLRPVTELFNATVGFAASGDRVDRRVGTGTFPWGAFHGGRTAGMGAAQKFRAMFDHFTKEMPKRLRVAPSGWGQLASIIAGAIAPTAGQLFWDDVWKGHGNILERGARFVKHLFDPDSIWQILKDAGSNVWDTIKSIGSLAKGLVTDPIGTIKESIGGMVQEFKDSVNVMTEQVAAAASIFGNPSEYAKAVRDEFMETAKEAMPNTEGLFNFADGGIVPGYSPDDDRVKALLSPGEAVLRPEAARALGVANIAALNKAAKQGKLPQKDTSKVIIPAPDAEAFKTAVNQIEDSLDEGRKSIEATKQTSNRAWTDTGSSVKTAVDSTIRPAMKRMVTEQTQVSKSSKTSMAAVKSAASSAASGTSKSFSDMKTGLKGLSSAFSGTQTSIDKSMDRIPVSVKSNIRSAVDFIQRAMISPVNTQLLGPAKLAKIGNLPQYATGGVVPGYAPGKDRVLALLSPGESVLRPEVTRAIGEDTVHALNQAAMSGRLPAFVSGGVVGKWDDAIPGMFSDTAGPILKNLVSKYMTSATTWPSRTGGVGVKRSATAIEKILDLRDEAFMRTMMNPPGDAVKRWTPLVQRVLKELGLSLKYTNLVLHRIAVESGGNPKAINLWDSNAKAGYPSQGLMQTIPQTFAAYAGPYRKLGITNPLASIYAGLNYAIHRYGSGWVRALSGTKGYARGTDGAAPGWAWVGEEGPELVRFKGGEVVLNARDSALAGGAVARGYASGTQNSGLYKAMLGSTSQLNSALSKLRDLLSKAFSAELISKSKHGTLSKWLEGENKKLTSVAIKRADIAAKIKAANEQLTNLKSQRDEMARSISEQASGGSPLTAAFGSGGGVSAASALSGLKDRLKLINTFKSNLEALRKKGYSQAIINEVAGAGLEQGNEMAKALLSASATQVKDITNTYSQVFKQSDALGSSVANAFYQEGEKSAKALISGLKSQESKVLKQIGSMVDKMIKEMRTRLGVSKGEPVRSDLASLFTWLTGTSQPAKPAAKKKSSSSKKKTKKYWTGTISASPGLALVGEFGPELVAFRGGERVYNARDTEAILSGRPIHITINEAKSEDTTQAVVRAFQYLDSMYGRTL